MTAYFNKKSDGQKRKFLRNNSPFCERLLWHYLKNEKLGYRFRRQFGIDRYVVDFYCPKLKLAIEIDGPTHEPDKDKYRQQTIELLGIKFIRFTNDQIVSDVNAVVGEITKELLPPTYPLSPSTARSPFERGKVGNLSPNEGKKPTTVGRGVKNLSPLTKGRSRGVYE